MLTLPSAALASESSLTLNGYVSERADYVWERTDVPLSYFALAPEFWSLTEANAQVHASEAVTYETAADVSVFASTYANVSPAVREFARQANLDFSPYQKNMLLISELYQNFGFTEHLTASLGKKRVVWGGGVAWNPADLLNVPKDPSDPALQRTGAWLAELETPFPSWTLSALFAPRVSNERAGIPFLWLSDGAGHPGYLAGARVYTLFENADINFLYFYTDHFANDLSRPHFAASYSKTFPAGYELHFEGLTHRGSTRQIANPACLAGGETTFASCSAQTPPTVLGSPDLHSRQSILELLVGTRYLFEDSSALSIEYLFNGEGLSSGKFHDRLQLLELARNLVVSGASLDPAAFLPVGLADGAPPRVIFEPLRRHYLFASFTKPRIRRDFTLGLTLIADAEDRSGIGIASWKWAVHDRVDLTLFAYVPFGPNDSEFGGRPQRARASLEARWNY